MTTCPSCGHEFEPVPKQQALIPGVDLEASVTVVFEHYQSYHPRSKVGSAERALIRARLREGWSVQELVTAIDGCHRSQWHKQKPAYQTIALIFRDSSKVQQFNDMVVLPEGRTPAREDQVESEFLARFRQ